MIDIICKFSIQIDMQIQYKQIDIHVYKYCIQINTVFKYMQIQYKHIDIHIFYVN